MKKGVGEFKGTRGRSISAFGHQHDVLISALQKYIRRGEVGKAIRVGVELDMFSLMGPQAEPIRSNMINRLAVIAMEDIGLANLPLLAWVEMQRVLWKGFREAGKKHSDTPGTTANDPYRDIARLILLRMIKNMALSQKSRLVSHARATFSSDDPLHIKKSHGIYIDSNIAAAADDETKCLWRNDDGLHLFLECLERRDNMALRWIYLRLTLDRRAHIKDLWDPILAAVHADPIELSAAQALHSWCKEFKTSRESQCYVFCAVLIVLRKERFPASLKFAAAGMTMKFVRDVYASRARFSIDGYCVDKHTGSGRARGKNTWDFVTEGALVTNAAAHAREPAWEKIYLELRSVSVAPLESQRFKNPVRCQLVTSNGKTCTYLAYDMLTKQNVFVKGPDKERACGPEVMVDLLKSHLKGMHPVGYWETIMKPDFFAETPLGRRRGLMSAPSSFLIAPDLNHASSGQEEAKLPTVIKRSKKWPDTAIYDLEHDKYAECTHADLDRPNVPLVIAICFRYALQIGDMCGRNFLVTKDGKKAYSLDENIDKYTPIRRSKINCEASIAHIMKFWEAEVRPVIKSWEASAEKLISVRPFNIRTSAINKALRAAPKRILVLTTKGPGELYKATS